MIEEREYFDCPEHVYMYADVCSLAQAHPIDNRVPYPYIY